MSCNHMECPREPHLRIPLVFPTHFGAAPTAQHNRYSEIGSPSATPVLTCHWNGKGEVLPYQMSWIKEHLSRSIECILARVISFIQVIFISLLLFRYLRKLTWSSFPDVGTYHPDLLRLSARRIILRKTMASQWQAFFGYLRTWSALNTFKERYPGDAAHPDGPLEVRVARLEEGDVTSMFDG